MKANQLICVLLLLVVGCGCNKKPPTSAATNAPATNSFDQFDATTNGVATEQPIDGIKAKAEKGDVKFPRNGGQGAENLRKKNRHVHENKTDPKDLRP